MHAFRAAPESVALVKPLDRRVVDVHSIFLLALAAFLHRLDDAHTDDRHRRDQERDLPFDLMHDRVLQPESVKRESNADTGS